jgi:hypothetical protein
MSKVRYKSTNLEAIIFFLIRKFFFMVPNLFLDNDFTSDYKRFFFKK